MLGIAMLMVKVIPVLLGSKMAASRVIITIGDPVAKFIFIVVAKSKDNSIHSQMYKEFNFIV